jgi:hypothetical protein
MIIFIVGRSSSNVLAAAGLARARGLARAAAGGLARAGGLAEVLYKRDNMYI